MEYFRINEKQNFIDNIDTRYNSNNPGTIWFFDTRYKLQYLFNQISKKLNISLVNNYNEKPNGMAGYGNGFKLKFYVLTGFIEKKFQSKIKKKCFLKLQFYVHEGQLYFSSDIDVNFSDPKNNFSGDRNSLQQNTSKSWKVDETFPKDWNSLIDLIIPSVSTNIAVLNNYITKQLLPMIESENEKNSENTSSKAPLNQILYGPPGTGKTYHTINKAINIINPNFYFKQERTIIKKEYNRLVLDNRILFTTFHQSMSYEDFIEGIKPVKPDDNDEFLKYNIQEGLFKLACANAAYLCYKKYQKTKRQTFKYTFDDLYDAFIEKVQNLLKNKKAPIYKTLTGKEVAIIEINSNDSIKARAKNSIANRKPAPLTKENLQKLYDKFNNVDEITTLKQVRETVEISPRITEFYAIFKGLKEFESKEFKPDIDILDENIEVESYDIEEVIKKFNAGVYTNAIKEFGTIAEPIVLIIDEINRGNVSQIFGELITLLEEDKRLGKSEALEVTLPYSKEKFGVPPNLYIVGTMNTADRSVESLDTALRRRFSFTEMMPEYDDLIEIQFKEFNLGDLLKVINDRIEVLLNRDHTIGHSYFIKIRKNDHEGLRITFKNNIIPLLQEYFYGDYEKIGLIIGKDFFEEPKKYNKDIFASFNSQQYPETGNIIRLKEIDENFDIIKAVQSLLNIKTSEILETENE